MFVRWGTERWKFQFGLGVCCAFLALLAVALGIRLGLREHDALFRKGEVLKPLFEESRKWTASAALLAWASPRVAESLLAEDGELPDESALLEVCEGLCLWILELEQGRLGTLEEFARRHRVTFRYAEREFRACVLVQDTALRSEDLPLVAVPAPPVRTVCFTAACCGGPSLEVGILRAIAALQRVLARLDPHARAAEAVRRAIVGLRRLLLAVDTTPVAITFVSPEEGLVTRTIPVIAFEMRDEGSGPDVDSRRLVAANEGPISTGTLDLTGFTRVVAGGLAEGSVRVETEGIAESVLADGFITLMASGRDLAGNAESVASRRMVLDRGAPNAGVTSPAQGSVWTQTAVPVAAQLGDLISGIALNSM